MAEKVSIGAALERMARAYEPEPVAQVDGHQALVVRYEGDYPEHTHDADEFLLCLEGTIEMRLPDGVVTLGPQEGLRIPAGVPHAPSSKGAVGLIYESNRIQTRLMGTVGDD
ncbi:MAG: cupin domain-containing protein [Euryarchaeota archaeon]|nr:cupin domain-containing protein [Euryarchaeota archaeon]